MKSIKLFIIAILFAIFSTNIALALEIGEKCPETILTDFQTEKVVDLRNIVKGKTAIVVFMKIDCPPCLKELKVLKGVDEDVFVITHYDGADDIKKFKERYEFRFTFLHDPSDRAMKKFGFSNIPSTVVLDTSGKIIHNMNGYSKEGMVSLINNIRGDAMK